MLALTLDNVDISVLPALADCAGDDLTGTFFAMIKPSD